MSNRTLAPTPPLVSAAAAATIRRPGQLVCPQGLVFPKLEQFVRRHIAKLLGSATSETAELFALVDGPHGGGKTVGITDGVLRTGTAMMAIPGAELAGENEGSATAALATYMNDAVAFSRSTGDRIAVGIEDAHQAIFGSQDSKLGKTVNSGLILNELQRIADTKPYRSACGTPIPMFFSGNDFSQTAPSLFRDRRANRHTQIPTFEEKIHVAFHTLGPRTREELNLVEKLVRHYRRMPIAFFAALRTDLLSAHIDQALPEGPLKKADIDALWPKRVPLQAELVWELAKIRAASQTLDNHY